jgi:hypothetical protein
VPRKVLKEQLGAALAPVPRRRAAAPAGGTEAGR